MPFPLLVAYVGNFRPEHSTENHVAAALRNLGHEVIPLQEDDPSTWEKLSSPGLGGLATPDFMLWTRTWSIPDHPQYAALDNLRDLGIPTVGYHLDRWWGLARETQVFEEPYFQVDLLVTADGGHDGEWAEAGINHLWMPPAILEAQAVTGSRTGQAIPVGFVGSWGSYHPEWPWRAELIRNLSKTYRHRFLAMPRRGRPAVRGQDLANLYATISVVVGDSCLAGSPSRYWSDRIPETLGRGGFLIHPRVDGIEGHFTDGEHLILVEPESWPAMKEAVDRWLLDPRGRDRIAKAGRAHVLANHTYEVRMADLIAHLKENKMLPEHADRTGVVTVRRQGVEATFDLRPDSTDSIVVEETWGENVYSLNPGDVAGKVVLDVGGNIGAFALWAVAAGAARVVAVEPAPANLAALKRNLDLNGWADRVEIRDVAVAANAGKVKFVYNREAPGGSSISPDGYKGETIMVDAVRLATLLGELGGHVDIMKVDIEGGEYAALSQAAKDGTLDSIDRIVGEWHTAPEERLFGRWCAGLLDHGALRIFGRTEHGGQFTWTRYGA